MSSANVPVPVAALPPVQTDNNLNAIDGNERSREPTSRRNRSRNRIRSRHREGRSHVSHRSRIRFKQKERNFAAAVCSMISIVILCTALAEPRWVSMKGGSCSLTYRGYLQYLGAYQFFYNGHFYQSDDPASLNQIYVFGPGKEDSMTNCVTYKTVILFKATIAFCFIGIVCSLFAFLLDLMGPTHKVLKIFRRNALFSILSVLTCVVINLFCYYITVYIDDLQRQTKLHKGSKVEVTFDVSFYLVTAAGGISVFSVAFNCLRRKPAYDEPRHNYILNDYDDLNTLLPTSDPESPTTLGGMVPPPAYSP